MQEKEFNLLEEPWIRVLTNQNETKEVSLVDVLIHAQDYRSLSGETPAQDFAMLRLLLAIAITVFYRYDADGDEELITEDDFDENDVLERWSAYWDRESLPEKAVKEYLGKYRGRFWLFHPETPFYQVANLAYGTDYGTQCLYGDVKSSNNKATKYHFSKKTGDSIENVSYAEAARWLLHLQGFGVNVKNDKNAPGTTNPAGVGRLGKLGCIYVDGNTVFELLMFNLTPLKSSGTPWEKPSPIWERDMRTQQSIRVPRPDNLPELYTLQSRRVQLKRENDKVSGFRAMNGDYYSYEDDFIEQMTLWRKTEKDKKAHISVFVPRVHNPELMAWREFPAIFITSEDGHSPGIKDWADKLCNGETKFSDRLFTFKTAGIQYGDGMSYTYGDCISDGITLSGELLKGFGAGWIPLITDEINKCEQVAESQMKWFAKTIEFIFNQDKMADRVHSELTGAYYSAIDRPFRDWLMGIRPSKDRKDESLVRWERMAYRCAAESVLGYIESLGDNRYKFRETDTGVSSVPGTYNEFIRNLNNIYSNINKPAGERSDDDEQGR